MVDFFSVNFSSILKILHEKEIKSVEISPELQCLKFQSNARTTIFMYVSQFGFEVKQQEIWGNEVEVNKLIFKDQDELESWLKEWF